MTDEQRQRIHDIEYSCDSREELAERIVALEDENAKLKSTNNFLHEMLSESRQANEHLYTELKRHKSILRVRPKAMTALYDENDKLRELITFYLGCLTKGHVNCDSCAFSGEDNCDHGRKVIESAKQVGIEVDE